MRDTSDFTDGTEQAKPVSTRPRTPARSKPEGTVPGNQEQDARPATRQGTVPGNQEQDARPATRQGTAPGNQEQDTRPAPRRRTPANSQGSTRHHNGNEGSITSTPTGQARPAQNQQQHSGPGPQRGGGNYGQRSNNPYPAQRPHTTTGQAQQRPVANNSAAPAAPP